MMWWNYGFWGSGWGWPVFAIMAVAMVACMAMMGRMLMRHGTPGPHRKRVTAARSHPGKFWPGGWPAARSTWRNSSAFGMHSSRPAPHQQTRRSRAAPDGTRLMPD